MSRLHIISGVPRHLGGWKKELPLPDSHKRTFAFAPTVPLPAAFDLSLFDQIPVYDQGQLGSCTANMGCAQFLYLEAKAQKALYDVSRLFLYAMTRHVEGTPLTEDSGCQIRDVYAALLQFGVCREELWPYSDDGVQFTVEPSAEAKADAAKHESILDYRCPNVQTIKGALIAATAPVGFGFTVFESFQSDWTARTGEVTYPAPGEKVLGGHANLLRGWDDARKIGDCVGAFRSRNSYGPGFGDGGDIWIPYKFFDDGLADDCHALAAVNL